MSATAITQASYRRRTLILCFACYTVSYLLRTNLSAVLDKLIAELQISRALAGSIGSLYFWIYALGQFINGYLAGRLNPKKMIVTGLSLSILINCLIGSARSYPVILLLWGLNGFSLSMIWGATFKILTNWHSPEAYAKVSVYISLPTTVGYLISWSVIRLIAAHFTWRYAFFLPAMCGAAFLILWIAFLQPSPRSAGFTPESATPVPEAAGGAVKKTPYQLLIGYGLIFVGLAAIVQGLIKESINLWAPTLMAESGTAAKADMTSLYAIGVPIAGTLGILAVGKLLRAFHNNSFQTLLVLFIAAAVSAGAVFAFQPPFFISVLLLSALMACVCGANVIITVFLPTGFVRQGLSTQVSGALNFMVYVGAGLGGSLSGLVSDLWGWNSLYLLWAALCMVALGVLAVWWMKGKTMVRGPRSSHQGISES